MDEPVVTQKVRRQLMIRGIRMALLRFGSATKVELSQAVGVSFPTVSSLVSEMEKTGEVVSAGLDHSSGGRRAERYRYNPEYMTGLALFLEKDETQYRVFNCLGDEKERGSTVSVLTDGPEALTLRIEEILARHPSICSMAIGVPGSVENGRIFYMPGYEAFEHIDVKREYEERFSIPVVVENDMNAAVLGYHANNGMEERQSLVYLYSGQNGPGAGIMVNGHVLRGSTFFSGEVSFVPQYDTRNFGESLEKRGDAGRRMICEEDALDAISRLVASFVAIINPHTFIFCRGELEEERLRRIAERSSDYVPAEHLPQLMISDWKQDYLYGLQRLALDLMLDRTNG